MENNLEFNRYKMYGQYGMKENMTECGMLPNVMPNSMTMPPYMYGKCVNPCDNMFMQNNQMDNYGVCPYRGEYNMFMQPNYKMQTMEPIEKMQTKLHRVIYTYVQKTVQKIVVENMGVMPKSISKDKYKKEINCILTDIMKQEDEIKKMVVIDRSETEESEDTSRAFCPYCNGMLQTAVSALFISELLRGGCAYCY